MSDLTKSPTEIPCAWEKEMVKLMHGITIISEPITEQAVLENTNETHSSENESNRIPELTSSNSFEVVFIGHHTNDWGCYGICDLPG